MNPLDSLPFREIWACDWEFKAPPGERPDPICLVAHELRSGQEIKIWQDQLRNMQNPPFSIDDQSLIMAYYASAEMACHLAQGWPLPQNLLDLYPEFRNATNGRYVPCGNGLIGALTWYGLDSMAVTEKENMRKLALRGGPWTADERAALLEYCASDVDALTRLLHRMAPELDLDRALLRSRFMKAAACIEHNGIPVDRDLWRRLTTWWNDIQDRLILEINRHYDIYEGRTFKVERFTRWLAKNDIPWPRLETGHLDLKEDTFKEMARLYSALVPLRELRATLSQLRLADLSIGMDGRNRCLLSAFQAKTGRNQPSSSRFVFGPATWVRGLIRPEPGHGIAYIDFAQQEHGIAAALSGDPRMLEAYVSGDPYLAFAKQAGAVPPDATKASHRHEREIYKACALGVLYGMESRSLALRIGQPTAVARDILRRHHETYPDFWRWSDRAVDCAMLYGRLWTVFGWTLYTGTNINPRSLRNFPMQSNGSEILRLACCFTTEQGIRVCAPVHDALLIEAPLNELDEAVTATQEAMTKASALVLGGFPLRSEAKIVAYPHRYQDERGLQMWKTIERILDDLETCPPENMSMVAEEQVDAPQGTPAYLISH